MLYYLAILVCTVCDDQLVLVVCQRVCMHWRLRDQTVWQWDTNYSTDKRSAAEQEKVPVESSRLFQGVLPSLGAETAYILNS